MASFNDSFQFQEAGNLLEVNRDATTVSIEDQFLSHENPRNASANGPEVDDVDSASDDKSELLEGQRKSAPFFTFEYYQRFFDIETHNVKERIIGSVLPWPGKNFIHVHLCRNPDLFVLVITFWPAITEDNPRIIIAVMFTITLLNILLPVGCEAHFVSRPEPVVQAENFVSTNVIEATAA